MTDSDTNTFHEMELLTDALDLADYHALAVGDCFAEYVATRTDELRSLVQVYRDF